MGMFDLPNGWVYVYVDGKWENVMNTDSITSWEKKWIRENYPKASIAKFVRSGKEIIFEL